MTNGTPNSLRAKKPCQITGACLHPGSLAFVPYIMEELQLFKLISAHQWWSLQSNFRPQATKTLKQTGMNSSHQPHPHQAQHPRTNQTRTRGCLGWHYRGLTLSLSLSSLSLSVRVHSFIHTFVYFVHIYLSLTLLVELRSKSSLR